METIGLFRLIPVPMHLDDPRWRSSWRRKPCQVRHLTEDLAREAAAQFFKPPALDAAFGSPWLDQNLVSCSEAETTGRLTAADLGAVVDLGGRRTTPKGNWSKRF